MLELIGLLKRRIISMMSLLHSRDAQWLVTITSRSQTISVMHSGNASKDNVQAHKDDELKFIKFLF